MIGFVLVIDMSNNIGYVQAGSAGLLWTIREDVILVFTSQVITFRSCCLGIAGIDDHNYLWNCVLSTQEDCVNKRSS